MTRDQAKADNRARFQHAAEWLDVLAKAGIPATVVYAENARGETIGKRDAGPFAEVRMNGDWA
jgi:hypothetical protein